jgi:hypothetical protein
MQYSAFRGSHSDGSVGETGVRDGDGDGDGNGDGDGKTASFTAATNGVAVEIGSASPASG